MQILTRQPADGDRTVSVGSERKCDSVIQKDLHLIAFLISNGADNRDKIDDHGIDKRNVDPFDWKQN